ncbi:MAG TPA: BadF/BadG/BcrA/BcrD ATPase family protein [Terriglobia bacterium]|nr:BadF/BadG/BcrA/BcrD ATPase family protein [Terriglobia bacterium]
MRLFLGVDGGQTATRTVVGNEHGVIVAQSSGGPSDHTEEPGGPERLERVVVTTIREALASIHISNPIEHPFAAACFGMTGETEIKTRILKLIVRTERLKVVHDSVNALAGATAGEPGIIVIAGTGSVARGINARGAEARVGGWGHQFGDEGSAYWIGRAAVRATLAEYDRTGLKTILTPLLFERLAVISPYQLTEKYYAGTLSRDHLAGLSVWVDEAARQGDKVALEILRVAGRDLARLALAVISLVFPRPVEAGHRASDPIIPVCHAGGVFQSELVLSSFSETLSSGEPHAEIRRALFPPVLGSLLLAYRDAGVKLPPSAVHGWPQAAL